MAPVTGYTSVGVKNGSFYFFAVATRKRKSAILRGPLKLRKASGMTIKTTPFDPAKYLTEPQGQAELLADALENGNASYIADALGIIARAHGMSKLARETGVSREALYKSLSKTGDPKISTLFKVAKALNVKLTLVPIKSP
jgi:probable addiction module antidote protein